MDKIPEQTFKYDKSFYTLMRVSFFISLAFVVFGLVFPFITIDEKNIEIMISLSAFFILFFGALSLWVFKIMKKIPLSEITIDDDGLWYAHQYKEQSLVTWGKIYNIKERSFLQCLDLLNSSGEKLMRIEYQIENLTVLRSILCEKVSRLKSRITAPVTFSKKITFHLIYVFIVVMFSVLGWYLGSIGQALLGYSCAAITVVLCFQEYVTTITKLTIHKDSLKIAYPFKNHTIDFDTIESINLADTFDGGNRFSEVWVTSSVRKKPFKIKQLGIDAIELHAVLHNNCPHQMNEIL